MKRILLFAGMVGLSIFAYRAFFEETAEPPTRRLSIFVDGYVDEIFGPLPLETRGVLAVPPFTQEILKLQHDITDQRLTAQPQDRLAVSIAPAVCAILLEASRVREEHIARLNQGRSVHKLSRMDQDPVREGEERLRFFEGAIADSWAEKSLEIRKRFSAAYARLRAAER